MKQPNLLSGLLLVAGLVSPIWAAETKVALCEYCNSSASRTAAETTALSEHPKLDEGVQFVFVVDMKTDALRYYEVLREQIEVCHSSTATEDLALSQDSGTLDIEQCETSWSTTSTEVTPSAADVSEIREAKRAYSEFREEIRDVDYEELEVGVVPVDSAVDLLGPGTAARRDAFMNALSEALADAWWERRLAEARDLGGQFWDKAMSNDSNGPNETTVHFPDGTRINVEMVTVVRDEWGNIIGYRLEIQDRTAEGEGLSGIPSTPAEFEDFFNRGFTANSAFVANLADLFVRGGGRIERNRSGGGCESYMECFYVFDADGGREYWCRITEPSPELKNC